MTTPPNRTASQTALGVAALRAVHRRFDSPPYILDDPIAGRLLGTAWLERLDQSREMFEPPESRALRSHVVLRSRISEDRLHEAVLRGVTQYVVLGAGLDTFAWRQPAWAQALHIIEVDQPASQAFKQSLLRSAQLETPSNVRLVAIDFEHESLDSGLARHGVHRHVPTFFSLLGVSMYLTDDAFMAIVRLVAAFPAGSEIVLTFAQPAPLHESDTSGETTRLAEVAAKLGEPWRTYFLPETLETRLRDSGFSNVQLYTPELMAPYFATRTDGLPAPRRTSIVAARV